MKLWNIILVSLAVLALTTSSCTSKGNTSAQCKKKIGKGDVVMRLATGSPGELGLLDALIAEFNKKEAVEICWIKAGSGKSLKLLNAKKADIVMVHAPAAEKKAIKDGWATDRTLLGSNEFYIVGPAHDPAGIASAKSAAEAYKKISEKRSLFMSRGDNSGTNKKELSIWKKANISPKGEWYKITKKFMMATLLQADSDKGYFMTDSSTWYAGKKKIKNLKVLFKGDPLLINTYHALKQADTTSQEAILAKKFIDFCASSRGQKVITEFGMKEFGSPLYSNARVAKKYDH